MKIKKQCLHMILLFTVILFIISCTGLPHSNFTYQDEQTGVAVSFIFEESIFPGDWYEEPISAYGESLLVEEEERSQEIIKNILKKYPLHFIRENLKQIYCFRNIRLYGYDYCPICSYNGIVYLVNDGEKKGCSENYIEWAFHHELNHILVHNYNNDENSKIKDIIEKWETSNPDSFSYGTGGFDARDIQATYYGDTNSYTGGCITTYGMCSLDDDIAEYAAALFTGRNALWDLPERFPHMEQKLNLIIEFYNTLDPIFTKEYFLEFSNNEPVETIICGSVEEEMFPLAWREKPINARAEELPEEDADPCFEIIAKALHKYPEYFIKDNISKIYIVKSLFFYNNESDKSHSGVNIYLKYNTESGVNNFITLERNFHLEFSRLLQYKYKYLINEQRIDEWESINPEGFSYEEENEELESASIYDLYTAGFLHKSALSSIYIDFNSYVGYLFMCPDVFMELAKKYPRILKKIDIVIEGYSLIDPVFTKDYFSGFLY